MMAVLNSIAECGKAGQQETPGVEMIYYPLQTNQEENYMKIINPADLETKEVKDNPLFEGKVSAQFFFGPDTAKDIGMGLVTFAPGARNVFHTHTTGQILYVTAGEGIVATEKEEVKVTPGMAVYIPAGEKHWHGATRDSSFSHISVAPPHQTEF
jgi:quercetin dioxygenase-like cupin family protein